MIAARSPKSALPEPAWKKFLRGFQVTIALAVAFLLMLVLAPALKIADALTGRMDVRLPLLTTKGAGPELVDAMVNSQLDKIDLSSPESGIPWYKIPKLDHIILNLRHIQEHAGQLRDRLLEAGIDQKWFTKR